MRSAVIWVEAARGVGQPFAGHIGTTTAQKIYSKEKTKGRKQSSESAKVLELVESGNQEYPAYHHQKKRLAEQERRMKRETGIESNRHPEGPLEK